MAAAEWVSVEIFDQFDGLLTSSLTTIGTVLGVCRLVGFEKCSVEVGRPRAGEDGWSVFSCRIGTHPRFERGSARRLDDSAQFFDTMVSISPVEREIDGRLDFDST